MTDPFQKSQPMDGSPQYGPAGTWPGTPYDQPTQMAPGHLPHPGSGPYPQQPYPQPDYAQPAYTQPDFAQPAYAPAPGGFLVAIGDIAVTDTSVITPSGTFPLRGSIWTATDMSHTTERMPPYAVVLAIIFSLACGLGLLFLLIKEQVIAGYIQVTVASEGRFHSAMIPVQNQHTFPMVMHQVNYARSLSAM
ncbi:hypothetical protein [Nocardia huaxiensis]|uniref:hypothetical protein n=1 Tax=Nocardia huaxiensis TaxID=2755382 RepID=UPI001E2EF901|nr:hypothetical protein [Nocardia huaxiensis]UFS94263.1 hypothetical protein LPY97_26310 [Nocardia huaxiensis]